MTCEWISVKDRLPEKLVTALPKYPFSAWMLTYSDRNGIEFGRYNFFDGEWHDDLGEVAPGITHWMQLPDFPDDIWR